jgi:hypothetical protein
VVDLGSGQPGGWVDKMDSHFMVLVSAGTYACFFGHAGFFVRVDVLVVLGGEQNALQCL